MMGFFLLVAAGNDSTKATYTSGMRALMEHPEQMRMLARGPLADPRAPSRSACGCIPAFAHFRRTATRDTEIAGQPIKEGEKVVMWYVSTNRDEDVYEDPDRFDVHRNPEHQAFGAGRPALLPRRCAGPARAADPLRGDRCAASRTWSWPAEPRAGRLGLPQPAEDAAGPLGDRLAELPAGNPCKARSGTLRPDSVRYVSNGSDETARPSCRRHPRGRHRGRPLPLSAGAAGSTSRRSRPRSASAGRRSIAGSAPATT